MTTKLPLKELSIQEIYNGEKATYEVPIYQRNYAWEKDEISTLVQDVYDAFFAKKPTYFIGTLVSFNKGDGIYEVIDGQQRLTTINLVLAALEITRNNKLTYRARKKSNDTIQSIPKFFIDEKDIGIENGFKYAQGSVKDIVPKDELNNFKAYFQKSVHLIHYQVPKDIDLNHYFEIMNSRGEQLEKHEIIKARLIEKLNDEDKAKFNRLWECCSEMNVYVQQKYRDVEIFGGNLRDFSLSNFDGLPKAIGNATTLKCINELISNSGEYKSQDKKEFNDSFQPIIDLPNFLLIVLKLTRMEERDFKPTNFNLDDKELINEFDKIGIDEKFVKQFAFNLLKAKYLLDNYIVHHANEDDTYGSKPWKLQRWQKDDSNESKNLDGESNEQNKLVLLLSMFEVSFSARQRKNYLFYCLLHLFNDDSRDVKKYCEFVENLADKYFKDVYLDSNQLNEINTPKPGSFDNTILTKENELNTDIISTGNDSNFAAIYGNGTEISKGVSLFVFNYLDFKLWKYYAKELRGEKTKDGSEERKVFFHNLGCGDFGLEVFDKFYFSRTRRSLEHYYPQALATGNDDRLNQEQINCFGNYAMIGSEINSSGSNLTPKAKLIKYLDSSGKTKLISVASLKFWIMMQQCKDEKDRADGLEWNFDDIQLHQEKMVKILFSES
ncbi:MAG: DUF262 domain-containing protein [Hydromonas sp.]|nr:DUF262 domain-containing protein [Hydromonas sp.]